MPTYLLTLAAPEAAANAVVDRLTEGGPVVADAAGAFDPGAGDWRIEAYFPSAPDEPLLHDFLAESLIEAGLDRDEAARRVASANLRPLEADDWSAIGLDAIPPVVAGRFRVFGEHNRPADLRRFDLHIEASTAFGTGDHASTFLSLVLLDRILTRRAPRRILDVGTGTGILGLAALKVTPAATVTASDIDAHAVAMAAHNRRLNAVGPRFHTVHAAGLDAASFAAGGPYDLVLANILPEPLGRLAPAIARLAAPGADLVLAGLRIGEARRLVSAYSARGFRLSRMVTAKEWAALHFVNVRSGRPRRY